MNPFDQALIVVRLPSGDTSSAPLSAAALARLLQEVEIAESHGVQPTPADALAVLLDGLAAEK